MKLDVSSIICCLQGGMGNQMFQYAMAKQVSINLNVPLYLNINRFKVCNLRQYSLCLWNGVNEQIVSDEPNIIKEIGMPFNQNILNSIKPGSSIVGYWQTEEYFKDVRPLLKNIFFPKQELSDKGKRTLDLIHKAGDRSVFLTVRRTDYLKNNFHGVLSAEYYDKALSYISNYIENPVIFIFSDEPEWCEKNMKLKYESHVAGNYNMTTKNHLGREDEELYLMMNCKHSILANSSYSWWGAWLGEKNSSIKIAPSTWFISKKEDPSDIVPSRWIKI